MVPVVTPLANMTLTAPNDWDAATDGICADLHVLHKDDTFTSFWKPDEQELIALNKGGYVVLAVIAKAHPPVSMGATMLNLEAVAEKNKTA